MRRSLIVLLVGLSVVTVDAQRARARRIRPGPSSTAAGGGVGCNGACVFSTSFTVAEGWSADVLQSGAGCSGDFSGHQSGISNRLSNHTTNCDEVSLAGNYASGAGGRGHRHAIDPGDNQGGGGIAISWTATPKIWYSYRLRYSAGMEWGVSGGGSPLYIKQWYDPSGSDPLIFGFHAGGFGMNLNSNNYPGTITWSGLMGGVASDGLWHCFDWHADPPNGRLQLWIDGTQALNSTTVNYGATHDLDALFTSNQSLMFFGSGLYGDYDDIKVDNDLTYGQRIGCPGTGG